MAVIGVVLRFLALFVMYKISNPKIVDLMPPLEDGPVHNHTSNGVKQVEVVNKNDESNAKTRQEDARE